MTTLRKGVPTDGPKCGKILFDAFGGVNRKHNFPTDFPSEDIARGFVEWMLNNDEHIHALVAEKDGNVIGSCFLWEDGPIAGIGPITVDPAWQEGQIGRQLMQAQIDYADEYNFAGIRLVQAGFNVQSLSLYAKLGFDIREPLVCLNGPAIGETIPGRTVRPVTDADVPACHALCQEILGHARAVDLQGALAQGHARLVEHHGAVTGYTTTVGFNGHSVGRSNDDLKALIASATEFAFSGFLLPSRNSELFRWCLNKGLRVIQPMTLMTRGLYNQPNGATLCSILY